MADDFLDEDDLAALQADLNAEFEDMGDAPAGGSGSGGGGGAEPESARPILKLICDQASSVVTTVLSKNVDLKIDTLRVPSDASVAGSFSSNSLIVKVDFEKDLHGSFYLVITKKDTAILSDLMMMGDGTADFEDDHKDALMELVNQIMGSVTTTVSGEYGIAFSVGQAEVEDYSPSSVPFALEDSAQADIDMRVEEISESKVLMFFDSQLLNAAAAVTGKSGDIPDLASFDALGQKMEQGMGSYGGSSAPSSGGGGRGGAMEILPANSRALEMLMDIDLNITIELGRTQMSLRRILEMGPGSIVEMERFAGEPVDLLVNEKVIAKGEVVVVDENFGIRIVSLVTPEERIKSLR